VRGVRGVRGRRGILFRRLRKENSNSRVGKTVVLVCRIKLDKRQIVERNERRGRLKGENGERRERYFISKVTKRRKED
jgi:hypothetical protein